MSEHVEMTARHHSALCNHCLAGHGDSTPVLFAHFLDRKTGRQKHGAVVGADHKDGTVMIEHGGDPSSVVRVHHRSVFLHPDSARYLDHVESKLRGSLSGGKPVQKAIGSPSQGRALAAALQKAVALERQYNQIILPTNLGKRAILGQLHVGEAEQIIGLVAQAEQELCDGSAATQ